MSRGRTGDSLPWDALRELVSNMGCEPIPLFSVVLGSEPRGLEGATLLIAHDGGLILLTPCGRVIVQAVEEALPFRRVDAA